MKRNELMITRTTCIAASLAMLTLAFGNTAQANILPQNSVLASFDLSDNTGKGLQAGFELVGHSHPRMGVQNNIELMTLNFRNPGSRNAGGNLPDTHAGYSLLADWHIDNHAGDIDSAIELRSPNTISAEEATLKVGVDYTVRLFHFDNDSWSNNHTGFSIYDQDRDVAGNLLAEVGRHGSSIDPFGPDAFTDVTVTAIDNVALPGSGIIRLEFAERSNAGDNEFFVINGVQVIPEPGMLGLLAIGGAFLGILRRRAK